MRCFCRSVTESAASSSARARLHFDEDQQMAAGGDDVDFAERAFPAPRQNAIAFADQPGGGAAFGGKAEAEGRHSLRARRRLSPTGCAAYAGAIAGIFREFERALIDLAARTSGGKRHFADRVLDRDALERMAQHVIDIRVRRILLAAAAPPR